MGIKRKIITFFLILIFVTSMIPVQVKASLNNYSDKNYTRNTDKSFLKMNMSSIPGNLSAKYTNDSITISWNSVMGASSYEVDVDGQIVNNSISTSFIHQKLKANSTHNYMVRAVFPYKLGGWSNNFKVTTSSNPPTLPKNVNVSSTKDSVFIKWITNEELKNVEIEADGKVINNGINTYFQQNGLEPATEHSYRIKLDNDGGSTGWSEVIKVKTLTDAGINNESKILISAPTVPTLNGQAVSSNSIKLNWNNVENATAYDVEIDGKVVTSANSTGYMVNGLLSSTIHTFRVRSKNDGGVSNWSLPLQISTLIDIPQKVNSIPTLDSIIVTWEPVERVTGFDVEVDGKIIDNGLKTTFIQNNLQNNAKHTYRVRAKNKLIVGEWSNLIEESILPSNDITPKLPDPNSNTDEKKNPSTADVLNSNKGKITSDTHAPTAPTSLSSSFVTCTTFTLSWKASTDNVGVTGYDIYNGSMKIGSTTGAVTYAITGLKQNTSYSFTVKAKDAAGNISSASTSLSIKTIPDKQVPTKPIGLISTSITSVGFTLSWKASTDNVGVAGYDIYNGTTIVGSTTALTYNISGLKPNTSYSFTVKAKDAAGNISSASTSFSVKTIPDKQAPTKPIGLISTSITSVGITLSWKASTDNVGVAGYDIYNGTTIVGSTTALTYNIIGLKPNTSYSFSVRARDAAGNVSSASTSLPVKTKLDTQTPTAPSKLSLISKSDTSVSISWTASTDDVGVTGYVVYNGATQTAVTTGTTYTVTGLKSNTTYNFTVRARDAAGNLSAASSILSVTTTDNEPPTEPTNLTASSITCTSLTLSWTASKDNVGIAGYDVYNGTAKVCSTTSLTCNVMELEPNTSYNFTVKAKDAAGNVSEQASSIAVTTPIDTEAPTAPTNLVASAVTCTSFNLSWASSTDNVGVTGYDIYNGTMLVGTSNTKSYTITGLSPNTAYTFTVVAKDAAGNVSESASSIAVTTPMDTEAPTAPTNLAASAVTSTTITLSWTASADNVGVTGYDIYNGSMMIGSTAGSTTYEVTGLTSNTVYSFTVVAKDASSNVSSLSNNINVNTLMDTPININAIVESRSINITWSPVAGAIGYDIEVDGVVFDNGTNTSYTHNNLTPNSQHTYRIRTRGLTVNSDWSTILNETTLNQTTINSDLSLTSDLVVGDLIINSGEINLNGFTLTVNGDLDQNGGDLYINGGKVHVLGNYVITGNSTLKMVNDNDYLDIDGNFTTMSLNSEVDLLSAGTIIIGKDFTQKSNEDGVLKYNINNFAASGTNTVILGGSNLHSVFFDSPENSKFNNLKVSNTEGVIFTTTVSIASFSDFNKIKNTNSLSFINSKIILSDLPPKSNYYVNGDLTLNNCSLVFYGNTLNVSGRLIQTGGSISNADTVVDETTINSDLSLTSGLVVGGLIINSGEINLNGFTLTVNGDLDQNGGDLYINGGKVHVLGNYVISGNSTLKMVSDNDYLDIDGSFTTMSLNSEVDLLSAGTIIIGKDFTQKSNEDGVLKYNINNFAASGTNTVILGGSNLHKVFFDSPENSKFNNLKVINTEGVIFTTTVSIASFSDFNKIKNTNSLSFINSKIILSDLPPKSNYYVDGDLTLNNCSLVFYGNTLNVSGRLTQTGGSISNSDTVVDPINLNVNGDIDLVGTINILANSPVNFNTNGNINIEMLENENGKNSPINITSKGNCDVTRYIENYYSENSPITINVSGDCNIAEIMNLNSSNSPITIIAGGNIGTDPSNNQSNLSIDSERCNNSPINITAEHKCNIDCIYNGFNDNSLINVTSIQDNCYINSIDNNDDNNSSINITANLICEVDWIYNGCGTSYCPINITANDIIIDETINNNCIGYSPITLKANNNFEEKSGIGNDSCSDSPITIYANGTCSIDSVDNYEDSEITSSPITINANCVSIGSYFYSSDQAYINGSLFQKGGRVCGVNLIISGNYDITNNSILDMTSDKDYVYVGGNFTTSSTASEKTYLTDGVLQINGNFTQSYDSSITSNNNGVENFTASDNHIVMLSGKDIQKISFENPTVSHFNVLVTTNPLDTGYTFNATPVWNYIIENYKMEENYGESTSDDGVYGPSGNFSKTFTDLTGGSGNSAIVITRTYNSGDKRTDTSFGKGWSFSYECSIKDYGGSIASKTVRLPDGSTQTFKVNSDGTYTATDSRNHLVKQSDGSYNLITKDQHTYGFNSAGYLVWIKDRYGNITNIAVNASGKVTGITDCSGGHYSVSYYSSGLIQSITDPSGRTVKYEYDNGELLREYDPNNHLTRYGYDSNGLLNSILDNDNNVVEAVAYNNQTGMDFNKVYQTTDQFGNVSTYSYDNAHLTTTITDSNGRKTVQVYDNSFNIISSTDAEGKTTYYTYNKDASGLDTFGESKSQTDRNGATTSYVRDCNGNIITQTNTDNSAKSYVYDSKNNLIQETDENGKVTYYIYDSNGIYLLQKIQPLNGTDSYLASGDQSKFAITTYTYYSDAEAQSLGYGGKGLLKQITDPNGNVTLYTYDAYGNVRTITDGENNTTIFDYNNIGWETCVTSPKGYKVNYYYDNDGNIIKTVLNGGETTRTVYDNEGRKVKEVSANLYDASLEDAAGNYSGDAGTRYTYYGNGKVKTVEDAENNITSYTYDLYGNVLTETKPDSTVYSYDYDVMNRVIHQYYQENSTSAKVTLADYSYTILSGGKTQKQETKYLNSTDTAVTTYIYDYAGRLIEQDNPDNTKLMTNYNANGTAANTTDAAGNVTYYKYDYANRLTEQWTPFENNSGTIYYSYTRIDYDKAGRKIDEVVGKDKVLLYSIPTNLLTTNYSYYNNDKLKTQTDSSGRRTDYFYDNDGYLLKQAVYVDAATQIIIEYSNNYFGKPDTKTIHIRRGDLYGNSSDDDGDDTLTTSYTYDKNGNLKTVTTPDGVTTTYGYDKLNRQISISQPGQDENGNTAVITKSQTLNYAGKVLTATDANNNTTTYVYDGKQELIRITDAKGNVSAYYYDNAGRKIADVQPGDYISGSDLSSMNRTEYSYDLMGRLKTITAKYYDAASSSWKSIVTKAYQYDANGNVTKELDALGYESGTGSTVDAVISSGYGTSITYNIANKPITVQDADTKDRDLPYTTMYAYDGAGRKVSETNAAGAVTTYYYDDAGNILKTTVKKTAADAEKTIKSATYDLTGNVITQTDGNGNVTTYEYNLFNKLRKVSYAGDSSILAYTINYQYDVMGNLKQSEDSMGKVVIYTYDNQNRVLSATEQAADGSNAITTSTRYDKNGNKRFVTDGNGNTTENTYDELNRLISTSITVTSINGDKTTKKTTYGYDAKGNKTSETDWLGNTTQYIYDALSRLIQEIDAYGKTVQRNEYYDNGAQSKSYDALNNVTQYFYDKNKRLIKTIDPANGVTQQTYDNVGNVATKADGNNNVTQYFYDEFNNLIKIINANNETTSYTYDLNGNMLTETDGKGNTTTYEYNSANKVVRRIDNGGRTGNPGSYSYNEARTVSYTYNADGSLKTAADRNGLVLTYTYDVHGRKLSETVGKINISYTYDNNGNQLTVSDSTGTTTRTYDELNRVTSKTVPSIGKSIYGYDIITGIDAGLYGESSTDPFGNVTLKVYDKDGRLYKVTADNQTATYSYYDNGSLKTLTYADGSTENYTYYGNNLLNTLVNKKSDGTVIENYAYTYDAAKNMLTKVDGKGTTTYTYDKLNRLQTVTEPDGTVTAYTFDAAGNRLTETVTKGTDTTVTTYNYNDQNRLTDTTTKLNGAVTQIVAYTYDNNGNELTVVTTPYVNGVAGETQTVTNVYDALNELIQTTNPDGSSIVNIYNGEGIRVAKATNGVIRRYLYEEDKVVLETDEKGSLTARNTYGTNLISRTTGGQTGYYFYNGHADVTCIIGTDGTVLATYYYDEFGNLKESSGTFDNPFRYSGYQYDSETGTYYIMCRMYDPETGRFLQEDTYRGDTKDPLSLNLYTYCHNEPLMYSDPTGHFWKELWGGIKKAASSIVKKASELWDDAKDIASDAWNATENTVSSIGSSISSDLSTFTSRAASIVQSAGDKISQARQVVLKAMSALKDRVSNGMSALKDRVSKQFWSTAFSIGQKSSDYLISKKTSEINLGKNREIEKKFIMNNDKMGQSTNGDMDSNGFLLDQGSTNVGMMSLGNSTLDKVGCECVATYNAMNSLGNKQNLSDIVNYYEGHGAMTDGSLGVNPDFVPGYFKQKGYKVDTSREKSQLNNISKDNSVVIVSFWNDAIPQGELHTVSLIKNSNGNFQVYNDTDDNGDHNKEYSTIEDYFSLKKEATIIRISGISKGGNK